MNFTASGITRSLPINSHRDALISPQALSRSYVSGTLALRRKVQTNIVAPPVASNTNPQNE
jgi:hypothetical protein